MRWIFKKEIWENETFDGVSREFPKVTALGSPSIHIINYTPFCFSFTLYFLFEFIGSKQLGKVYSCHRIFLKFKNWILIMKMIRKFTWNNRSSTSFTRAQREQRPCKKFKIGSVQDRLFEVRSQSCKANLMRADVF